MKVMVSAGEVSGDVHGSYLVRELKKIRPDIYFFGMGGEMLAAAGVDIKFDISRRGTIGVFEALPNILPIYFTFLKMKKLLLEEKPDLVLLIDSQGFNLPFAKFCKKAGVKTVYYIAPQEWLWGTPRGVKKVAETVNLIVAIFEKEYEAYKKAGANVAYFGHPLVDIVTSRASRIPGQICLCPGSRTQEIKSLFPVLLEAAALIQKELPETKFIIPAASEEIFNKINSLIRNSCLPAGKASFVIRNLRVQKGQAYDALAASDLAICVSGTINLEASILGIPNIMVYKLSPLTYWIGKHILKIGEKLKYFSMPNILLDEKVVPELVMKAASPERIAEEALSLLKNQNNVKIMKEKIKVLAAELGHPGVIRKAAKEIISFAL